MQLEPHQVQTLCRGGVLRYQVIGGRLEVEPAILSGITVKLQ